VTGSFVASPLWAIILGLPCGAVGFRVGWRTRTRWGLPLVQTALGGIAFLVAWSAGGPGTAAVAVIGWAVGITAASVPTFRDAPRETDDRVLRATAYRAEMRAWLATGRGPEAIPVRTAARHAFELVVYVAAAVATMNLLALAMGAVLLNYMNAWVAALLRAARDPWTVRLLAWNVWSAIRVVAYVLIGVAGAAPVARAAGLAVPAEEIGPLAIAGGIGVALDLALKLALSRPCARRLAAAVDLTSLDPPAGEDADR